MSTTQAAPRGTKSPAAPWRSLFLEHVQGMKSAEFTLSTIRKTPVVGGGGDGGYEYMPRARVCVFRGLWAQLPVNGKNTAELNRDVYESDMPTFTTDVRMDKMPELWGASTVADPDEWTGSGGGGAPVEAVFWAKEAMTQWRVRGEAYLLGPDVDDSAGGKAVQERLRSEMRRREGGDGVVSDKGEEDWRFGREVTAHFGNVSPGMRGTFRNPPPGTPVECTAVVEGLGLGQKVTDLQDPVARANFRVVVVVPREVDRADLSDPARGRRWIYNRNGAQGEEVWTKTEVWP